MPIVVVDLELRDLLVVNPFLYPKAPHYRALTPTTVASQKPTLRLEFGFKCVYCRLPEGIKGQDNFGIDHYRPRSLYPELKNTYSNLFYACNACNRRKKNYWPSAEDTVAGRFIPNPCDHVMFQHLRYRGPRVEPHSPAGHEADKRLMFNDDESVQYREFVLGVIAMSEDKKRVLAETLVLIQRKSVENSAQAQQLLEEKQSCVEKIKEIDAILARLTAGG